MAAVVKRDEITEISSRQDTINHLAYIYNLPSDPINLYNDVRISNRLGVPQDVGAYDVGIFTFGKPGIPIVNLAVLTLGGDFTIAAVPKASIVDR